MTAHRVTVITLTYRRPDDLRAALPLLRGAIADHPQADLLVVDNDESPSAEPIVREFADQRVRYVHEPRPGIASARNRGLDESEGSRFVVFIDDDERPQPGWLASLLRTQAETGAAAVAGTVISEFPGTLDPWIAAGGYFDRLRHPTGTRLEVAATNNLLLDRDFVVRSGLRFDEKFGLSGGSDSVFTRQLVKAGGALVWCDEALVVDVVPTERATREWVVRRGFRMGNTEAHSRIHVSPPGLPAVGARIIELGRGLLRVVAGAALGLRGVIRRSLADRARGTRTVVRGAGMALAAVGYRYFEYRRKTATRSS